MGISVFIVDRERTFADALAARLEAEPDVEVVAAVHGQSPPQCMFTGRQADVVLLDADLAGGAAVSLCAELAQRDTGPQVMMLSDNADAERIISALRAGASAWVCKGEPLRHLIDALRSVARGEAWLPPSAIREVLSLLLRDRERRDSDDSLLSLLTPREREVLACLAEGAGRHEVARRLHLSANTVRTHLQNLMAKLGVHSTLEAVALSQSLSTSAIVPGEAK